MFQLRTCVSNKPFRTGVLQDAATSVAMATPAMLTLCQRAAVPYISADAAHIAAHTFLAVPYADAASLRGTNASLDELMRYRRPTLLTQRLFDSASDLPMNTKGVTFDLARGRTTIGADQFVADVRTLKPALAESLHPSVTADKSRSRHGKVMKQTLAMLNESAQALGTDRLFAVLQGGADVGLREIAARDLLKGQYAGYSFAGLGTGETVDERAAVLRAIVPALPAEKPRMIAGIDSFEQILACVAFGIDLFVSRVAQTATEDGRALGVALAGADVGLDRTLALRDAQYRVDKSAIDADCACYTCRTHSRAYVNHLLNTHELLAPTLLMYHNLHVMEQFFAAIRAHIESGTFETFHSEFVANRRREFDQSREPLIQN